MADQDIDSQIKHISAQLNRLTKQMYITVSENKSLKKKASKRLKEDVKTSAPKGPTGNLQKSIQYLPFKSSDVFIGPSYRIAPHAHLVEYGFVHYRDKKRKDKWSGIGFMRKAYDRNKAEVLQNLIWLAAEELDKIGRELEVRE